MKYRTLGKTGMKVSVIGVGTWQYGGEWGIDYTAKDTEAILSAAMDSGINLIDTAECYGDHLSESLIAPTLGKGRDKWVVATKFGHKFHGHQDRTTHFAPREVEQQLNESLKALGTDYVDLYQFHSGSDEDLDTDGLWEMLGRQVEAGKIRHLGNSVGWNGNVNQIRKSNQYGIETIQIIYNRINQKPEEEAFDVCIEQNLGVLARVPLASGFLSGKYKPGASFPSNDVRASRDPENVAKTLEWIEAIRREEVPEGTNMAQWALGWCLKHPAVSCVIPGCKSVEQVRSNAAAADLDVVPADHPQAAI